MGGVYPSTVLWWAIGEGDTSGRGPCVCHLGRHNVVSTSYRPGTQIRRAHVVVYHQPKDALLPDKGPETMVWPVFLNSHWSPGYKLWVSRVLLYDPCGQHRLCLATGWVTLSARDQEPGQEKNLLWFCVLGNWPLNSVPAWRLMFFLPADVILGLVL